MPRQGSLALPVTLQGFPAATAAGTGRWLQMTGSVQGAIMMAAVFILCSKWINHSKWASPPSWNLLPCFCPDTNIYPAHGGSARSILQAETPAHSTNLGARGHCRHGGSIRAGLGCQYPYFFYKSFQGSPTFWEPEVPAVCQGLTGLLLQELLRDTEVTLLSQGAAGGPQGIDQIHCWLSNRRLILPR